MEAEIFNRIISYHLTRRERHPIYPCLYVFFYNTNYCKNLLRLDPSVFTLSISHEGSYYQVYTIYISYNESVI